MHHNLLLARKSFTTSRNFPSLCLHFILKRTWICCLKLTRQVSIFSTHLNIIAKSIGGNICILHWEFQPKSISPSLRYAGRKHLAHPYTELISSSKPALQLLHNAEKYCSVNLMLSFSQVTIYWFDWFQYEWAAWSNEVSLTLWIIPFLLVYNLVCSRVDCTPLQLSFQLFWTINNYFMSLEAFTSPLCLMFPCFVSNKRLKGPWWIVLGNPSPPSSIVLTHGQPANSLPLLPKNAFASRELCW